MSNRASMGHIYDRLKQKGIDLTPPPGLSDDDRSPWYIQGMMGCGGWIAALFMMGIAGSCISTFLISSPETTIGTLLIIVGLIAITGTIFVAAARENIVTFLSGILLPVHIAGHIMLSIGIEMIISELVPYDYLNPEMNLRTYGFVFMIVGIIYLISTTSATRYIARIPTFASYLYLISHLVGHGMVLFGIGSIMTIIYDVWDWRSITLTYSIIVIMFETLFIVLYPNAILRFLATLAISGALFTIAFTLQSAILVSLLIGILMILTIVIWSDRLPLRWQIQSPIVLHPIAYGAILSAYLLLVYEVSNRYSYSYNDVLTTDTAYITTIILCLGLIWLEVTLMRDYKVNIRSPYAIGVFIITVLIALPVYATPGILAAIIGILLAFRRRNRILLVLTNVYLAGFIGYYYFWLNTTLLTKSIILITTGVLLIASRLILRRVVIVPDEKKGSYA